MANDIAQPASSGVKRIIWIILDSLGLGALPDAAAYGDADASTLEHVAATAGGLALPNLEALGLGNIIRIEGVPPAGASLGSFGKMVECSPGKDSATGHWELAGLILERPFPSYPQGFPPEIIKAFEAAIGREVLGNKPASGTEIIQELGQEHLATGKPIVYTSVDSVFQIAAHKDVIPLEGLYEMCEQARRILTGEHNIARVIARPFIGSPGEFSRVNSERRDLSIEPIGPTVLDCFAGAGLPVCAIGKIQDLFAGRGITRHIQAGSNAETIEGILDIMDELTAGLIMGNLVDFDMVYGHRNDAVGYASALIDFDRDLGRIRASLRDGDVCIIASDHGCDPTTPGTDHTREYAILLIFGKCIRPGVDLGIRRSFADCGASVADLFGLQCAIAGESFAADVLI